METYGWACALFWIVVVLGGWGEFFLILLENHLAKIENKLEKISQQMAQRGDNNDEKNTL